MPRSAKSKRQVAVEILTEAIAGLESIREYVESTERENDELRAKLERILSAIG